MTGEFQLTISIPELDLAAPNVARTEIMALTTLADSEAQEARCLQIGFNGLRVREACLGGFVAFSRRHQFLTRGHIGM